MFDVLETLSEPTSRALAEAVARAVATGSLPPGTRLPPIRTVATELRLSPTTVGAAWSALRRAGTIHTDGRRGSFVAQPRAREAGGSRYRRAVGSPVDFALDLSTGVPDPTLLPGVDRVLGALRHTPAIHSYLDRPMLPELEAQIERTWPFVPERLMLVDGATDAMAAILHQYGGYGVRVAIEDPAFPPFLDLLDDAGMRPIPVALDREGPRPDALATALDAGATLFVLQPRGQNPTGVTVTEERCVELARVLAGSNTVAVEDDSLDGIASTPLASIGAHLPHQVLHIRSFSKAYGPDLRLAAIGGAAALIDPVQRRRQLGQGWSSRLLQRLLLALLTDEQSRREVAAARHTYARRRRTVVDALGAHGVQVGGDDGINLWMPVLDEVAALQSLAAAGIGAAPGSPFQIGGGHRPHVRITVGLLDAAAGEVTAEAIAEVTTDAIAEVTAEVVATLAAAAGASGAISR